MLFDKIPGLEIPPVFFLLTLPLFILAMIILWKAPQPQEEETKESD
jgi:hypothetical protein